MSDGAHRNDGAGEGMRGVAKETRVIGENSKERMRLRDANRLSHKTLAPAAKQVVLDALRYCAPSLSELTKSSCTDEP